MENYTRNHLNPKTARAKTCTVAMDFKAITPLNLMWAWKTSIKTFLAAMRVVKVPILNFYS